MQVYEVVTFFVSSYHLLGAVQLLPLRAEVVHIINLTKRDYCMCHSLWSNRLGDVYPFPVHAVGLPTPWPWSQLLLISLERRGMLCLKDDSLNKVGSPLLGKRTESCS